MEKVTENNEMIQNKISEFLDSYHKNFPKPNFDSLNKKMSNNSIENKHKERNLEREKAWKEKGLDIKYPLHFAAAIGNLEQITNLISKEKINPNLKMELFDPKIRNELLMDERQNSELDDNEYTPLGIAVYSMSFETVFLLIKLGGDPFILNKQRKTLIYYASQGWACGDMVRFLQRFEIFVMELNNKKFRNYFNDELLKKFVDEYHYEFDNPKISKIYAEEGDEEGLSENQIKEIFEIKHSNDLKIILNEGITKKNNPLHLAAAKNDENEIERLIKEEKIDPNLILKDNWNREPLDTAAFCGSLNAIKMLIKLGADPFRPINEHGRTLYQKAARSGYLDVMEFFEEYEKIARREVD